MILGWLRLSFVSMEYSLFSSLFNGNFGENFNVNWDISPILGRKMPIYISTFELKVYRLEILLE